MGNNAEQSSQDLVGQVAIVTGGGRGIGREIALSLAEAGAAVSVIARSEEQLNETVSMIQKAGGRAIAISADVTNRGAINHAIELTERELGPIDLLVNNAGSLVAVGPAWESDPDIWWRDVEVNLRGTYICTHGILPGMVARKRGRVINFSSRGMPYLTAYAASKTAVTRFTHLLASEIKDHGISVFSISGGPFRSAMMDYLLASKELSKRYSWIANWNDDNWAPIESATKLVLFLASGEGDALSGRHIGSSDNWHELVQRVDEIERDNLHVWHIRTLPED